MTEPVSALTSGTVGAYAGGFGVVILGIHTGLDYPTLLAGLAGGATALSYLGQANIFVRALQVISAAVFAGYLSPLVTYFMLYWAARLMTLPESIDKDPLQIGIGFTLGFLAHGVLLPGLMKVFSTLVGRYSKDV